MADRIDIDALLIGALYGELTPADEARLTAHLESHPADRNALDDLTRIRAAVRESRVLDFQFEPPQAISALLLQEASRRGPRSLTATARTAHARDVERESWFQRFVRSFMAHPAMAAAAMLVVVVGVAGTLYLRGTDQFAAMPAPSTAAERAEGAIDRIELERRNQQAEAARTITTGSADGFGAGAAGAPGAAAPAAAAPASPPVARPEDSGAQFRANLSTKPSPAPRRAAEGRTDDQLDLASHAQLEMPAKADTTRAKEEKAKKVSGIELRTPQLSPRPKDLQDESEPQAGARPSGDHRGRDARAPSETGAGAPPPPSLSLSPPPAATAPAAPRPSQDRVVGSARGFEPVPAPEPAVDAKRAPPKPVGKGQAAPTADPAANDKAASTAEAKQVDDRARTLEWARKQHDQVVALVSSSRCQEAA
ncbi:MAG TPA: hypothetical protein VK607_21495, partial [Kofleriaceae bacterium]|nr:hypothetical protein [Kofleriaceae bacterium]